MGILAEISMRAKILKSRLKDDPGSIEKTLEKIELLEHELMRAIEVFSKSKHR